MSVLVGEANIYLNKLRRFHIQENDPIARFFFLAFYPERQLSL
ncbi:hypothetical protein [uncultured Alteromonas sp.]|jgi:hypothetical protein|tara:strand:- start:16611 stop:16739 length:129 start_codon:yes stop_codon:yes gene_type:complete